MRLVPRFTLAALGLALALPPALAAPAPAISPAPLSPEQALARRQLADLRASPGGERVTFTVTEPPSGERARRHVWVLDVKSRAVRQLTNSAKSEWSARWSPAGGWLAFLSNRGEHTELWRLALDGGEAVRVADLKSDVAGFEWSPDGKQLAVLAPEPKPEAEEKREKEKDDAQVVDVDDRPACLWLVDAESGKARQLTSPPWRIAEVQWAPAGDRLYVAATDRPALDQWTDRLFAVDAKSGKLDPLATPKGPFGDLRISPSGRSLAYLGSRGDGPSPHDLFLQPLDPSGSPAKNLTGAGLDRPVDAFEFRDGSHLVALAEVGFGDRLYDLSLGEGAASAAPKIEARPELATPPEGFALLPDGGLALVAERMAEPAEIWLAAPGKAPEKVTHLNESAAALPAVAPELVRYKSFDGQEIEGAILKPASWSAGSRLPLVVLVHGGPTGRWRDRFESWGQLLAARGFLVFYPNPRGSSGYGHAFLASNRADWGGGDYKDIMAGVNVLVQRGLADPDHLGIGGWSYGGYMAAWAITQTPRFKAAVAGAGLSDLASEFGTEAGSAYDEWFYGLPYEHLDRFQKSSPITHVKNAKTPTLLLQGEADTTDPVGQSQQLYHALKRYGVPTQLVLYPREGHGLREEKHLLDRLNRVVAWYEKYLK
ncbi:MAG TPA: S9 family peptidase [Thermoanaerobaculia bacterium]|nr:S9 family peptidase [Thermoanaerobaculia bacterium]